MLFLDITDGVSQNVTSWGTKVKASFDRVYSQIADLLPNIIGMLVVLVIGYIVAKLLERVVASVGQSLGLDTAAERSGLAQSMRHVGIERSMPAALGKFTFWMTLCVFVMAGFNILHLELLTPATEEIMAYIPKVLVATVLVVVGLLAASFLRGVIATSADRVGIAYAGTLANACYYLLALMTVIVAFDQLNLHTEMLNNIVLIAFGAVGIGFGLSFGLGGRDVMAGILAGYYTRQRLQPGDRVEVAGLEGTVREVGPVATIIETEEHGLMNRHSIPNTRMLNEAVR